MRIRLLVLLLFCASLLAAVVVPDETTVYPISVSLTGFVEYPGVYQLSPVNRLSDLLNMQLVLTAEAVVSVPPVPAPEPSLSQLLSPEREVPEKEKLPDYKKNQALRSLRIIRDGSSTSYDLLRFYRLGDATQNPFLKDGDVVVVSAISSFTTISGGVSLPGEIEFLPGDKLSDILALSKGFSFAADRSKLICYRYAANRIDHRIIKLDLQQNPDLNNFALQADDRIMVPLDAEISTRPIVKVSGMVKNPGEYLVDKTTTLYDIILQAGGFTSRADVSNLVYYSENVSAEPNPYLDVLMKRTMSEMTPLEYSYLRTNLLQLNGKYSVDARKMVESEGREANPVLHNSDHIFVPEIMDVVWVSGQVRHPGLVTWIEGKDWNYYINAAGGYANNRKHGKGRLIRGKSGNWVKPNDNLGIMPGDTVFVPGQTDRSLWTDVKDIVTLSSSLITIIIGLRALTTK